jgi:hypothetical protein
MKNVLNMKLKTSHQQRRKTNHIYLIHRVSIYNDGHAIIIDAHGTSDGRRKNEHGVDCYHVIRKHTA